MRLFHCQPARVFNMQMHNMPEIMTNLIISAFNRYEGKNNKLPSFVQSHHIFGAESEHMQIEHNEPMNKFAIVISCQRFYSRLLLSNRWVVSHKNANEILIPSMWIHKALFRAATAIATAAAVSFSLSRNHFNKSFAEIIEFQSEKVAVGETHELTTKLPGINRQ